MGKKENKKKGPTCACGKGDLYEEWKENQKKVVSSEIKQKKENSKGVKAQNK